MTALERLIAMDAPARLHARDATLFSADPVVQSDVEQNLGWTRLAAEMAEPRRVVEAVVADITAEEPPEHVVLLGMGGSSLASLVMCSVLSDGSGPRLHVLDTTSPITVQYVLDEIYPARTVFVVASKSGTTIEPLSLYEVFRAAADDALDRDEAGARFIAITDPGTPLETLAAEQGFRAVVPAPPTVGGRYSALTVFGLLPAALMGFDLDVFVERAERMEALCALPAVDNPAAQLAAFAVDAQAQGRDKLTLVASPGLESFGLWVEQLVAESLGKEGTGIVPVVELSADKPLGYGPDRAIVVLRFEGDDRLDEWAEQWECEHPVMRIDWRDGYDVGAEFVRWEHAVAMMGPLLGVNPFGQPNVAAAKAATAGVLDGSITPPEIASHSQEDGAGVTFAGALHSPGHAERTMGTALGHAIAALQRDDFLAVLAYLPYDDDVVGPLREIVPRISAELGVAVTLEIGPRYLHSTGQLHKGGRDAGVYVIVTTADETDVDVPGRTWGLRDLHRAQAMGDLATLAAAGRRALWLDLADTAEESIGLLVRGLADAAGVVTEEQ